MEYTLGDQVVPVWAIPWVLSEGNLRLPSFQRDAVWDEERVELLWDSLLRGMPLGHFIVVRAGASEHLLARGVQGSRCDVAENGTFGTAEGQTFLLDGQQRAIAIRQGLIPWREPVTFRLWIDVAQPAKDLRRKEHTVVFPFYLCTRAFPWGTRISDDERRRSRGELKRRHPDQIKTEAKSTPDYLLQLGYTWPAKAHLPIPFANVARWLIGGLPVEPRVATKHWPMAAALSEEAIRQYVDALVQGEEDCIVASPLRERWQVQRDTIVTWVRTHQQALCRALNRRLYFERAFENIEQLDAEELGEAFNRLNRLGVRLDGADLFFSALKVKWPQAHDMVWSLYQDRWAGKLLTPPQIAHAAVRLAITDYNREHSSEPTQKLRDRLGLGLDDARVLLPKIQGKLRALIAPRSEWGPSCLQALFQRLRGTLEYRYEDKYSGYQESTDGSSIATDFRLPLPLLARLGERRAHIVHNLLVWLYRNPTRETSDVELRRRMVRYALVDYFFLSIKDDYRRQAFAACEQASGSFPDIGLITLAAGHNGEDDLRIQAFWEQQFAFLKSPADFELSMRDEADPVNLDDLLLWAQRDYLHRQFPDYDPTLFFNAAALPWDRDHIWPQAKMDGRSVGLEVPREIRDAYKWRYLHSFGNLRVMERGGNRAAGAKLPSQKFAGGDEAERDFAISHDVFDRFCNLALSPEDKITQEFLDALKDAVNARRASLYRELYDTLCLDELRHEGSTPQG